MIAIDDAVTRLDRAAAGFRALLPAVEAGQPWPLHDVAHDAGPESAWGPTEVLAHVAEMLPFWLAQIERIVAAATEPVPFGRTTADPVRTETIARDRTLPPVELIGRIEAAVARYARRLPELGSTDLARRGLHPIRGAMTIGEIVERFVVGHAEEHVDQLRSALSASGTGPPGERAG